MVQRAVLLLCTAALDIAAAASPGELPVPAWPGAFNLPLLPSQRSPAIFAPSHTATGLALRELVAPFVRGGHCAEPYLAVKGDAGENVTEATRLRLEAVCLLNDADKLLDFMASADEMVSLTLRYEYLGADDLSKLGEILEPFPAIEPEWNCSSSTQHTTAHLYLSSANASALPEHADKGDVLVLQVAGSKDWTYAPVSERHAARRDEAHQSRALAREHATLTPGSAMRVPAEFKHSARAASGFSAHITMETMTHPPAGSCPDAIGSPVSLEVPASMRSVDHWKDMIAIASNCVITFPGRNCTAVPSEPLPAALPAPSPTRASVVSVAAATAALSVGALRASPSERTTKHGFRTALVSVLLGTAGSIDDADALAERLASTETVVDQLLSMMEALQEQIAGSPSAQKEEARVRRKLSGSTETGYLGWDGVNFYIEGGGLAMDQNSLTVSGRDVKTSLEALDGYFARPWNQAVAFHAVKTADQDTIAIGDVVTFDKELLDVGNGYDPSTSVYTVPTFGLYRMDIMIICGKLNKLRRPAPPDRPPRRPPPTRHDVLGPVPVVLRRLAVFQIGRIPLYFALVRLHVVDLLLQRLELRVAEPRLDIQYGRWAIDRSGCLLLLGSSHGQLQPRRALVGQVRQRLTHGRKLYLAKVHAAGGWKRYAQEHAARLAPIFAKVFPLARLPPELVSHIVGLWAHVGYY
jgi:hypothetical protein